MTDREQNRDAVSGHYVTEAYAEENPDTTVTEHTMVASAVKHDPMIGKIVHYVSYGTPGGEYTSECRAAVVVAVSLEDEDILSLCVLNPTGQFFNQNVKYDPNRNGGTWHY